MCALLAVGGCEGETSTLRIEWEGSGFARVTSDPPGVDCSGACEARLATGSVVTLHVEPLAGSRFLGFEGCDDGTACTVTLDDDRTVVVSVGQDDTGVRLSETDRHPELLLSGDGLRVDFPIAGGGVRSVQSVGPGSGVHYFEVTRLVDELGAYGFGVGTARAPLMGITPGSDGESIRHTVDGTAYANGEWRGHVDLQSGVAGMVVDCRGGTPVVHVVTEHGVARTEPLAEVTEPLHIYLIGTKRAPTWQLAINPGNDVVNAPFALDPARALSDAGQADAAAALTLGWGASHAGAPSEPPALVAPPDRDVARGTEVVLEGSATDAEDGDLSDRIEWELAASPYYAGRVRGTGRRFAFTPDAVGVHPVVLRVRDSSGRVSEATVRVRVPGPVALLDEVRLELDPRAGDGIELSPDGLAARWTGDGKNGVRANQALYGEFWYFEMTRLIEPFNPGGGVVTGDGNLGPYTPDDVPPSASLNTSDGVYRDLLWHSDLPSAPADFETYGFAVDYRGEHPIVYFIANDQLLDQLVLDDVWVAIHPMIYGNPSGMSAPGSYDMAVDFGATPFVYDPRAILEANGVDASALELGWGG